MNPDQSNFSDESHHASTAQLQLLCDWSNIRPPPCIDKLFTYSHSLLVVALYEKATVHHANYL